MTRPLLIALLLVGGAACHRKAAAPASSAAAARAAKPHHHDVEPEGQAAGSPIEIVVNGKPAPAWTPERLASASAVSLTNQNGEQREGWPLKPLTQSIVGPKARIVALATEDERVAIDAQAWNDPTRTLILRLSRRGQYKANWVQAGVADDALLKGITRIEIAQ
jgi:hypothetical protein